jgi:hypothetical protein
MEPLIIGSINGSCEHGSETLGSINGEHFSEQPSDYQPLKYDPSLVIYFIKPPFPEDFPDFGSIRKNI